jgi:iron uptake system EfeUOB component EfeO/EfeM
MAVEEIEANNPEKREVKWRKLTDSINEEIEEVQEDFSKQVTSLLGEFEKKKSEGLLVMVSSGFLAKKEHIYH